MTLQRHFETSGSWLFRHRSYVPLIPIFVMLLAAGAWGDVASLPGALVVAVKVMAAVISALGVAIRAHAVGCAPAGTSGRNTREQIASTLNTTGLYSVVRHPLYVGNYLMGLGVSFLTLTWWLPVLYSLFFWVYYERIMFAEEAFLRSKFGEAFEAWAEHTPAFVPRHGSWRAAELPFSLRNVLRREYNGTYAVVLLFVVFMAVADAVSSAGQGPGSTYLVALAVATAIWLGLRFAKRRTSLLDVRGR